MCRACSGLPASHLPVGVQVLLRVAVLLRRQQALQGGKVPQASTHAGAVWGDGGRECNTWRASPRGRPSRRRYATALEVGLVPVCFKWQAGSSPPRNLRPQLQHIFPPKRTPRTAPGTRR